MLLMCLCLLTLFLFFFFFKQKTAYEMRISDWSSDVCSSDLLNPQIPWISDPEGQIVEVGPRWTELTGTPAEDALGAGWTNSLHPDDLPGVLAHWEEALTSVDNAFADVRYRVRNSDGSYRRSEEQTSELKSLMRISYAV